MTDITLDEALAIAARVRDRLKTPAAVQTTVTLAFDPNPKTGTGIVRHIASDTGPPYYSHMVVRAGGCSEMIRAILECHLLDIAPDYVFTEGVYTGIRTDKSDPKRGRPRNAAVSGNMYWLGGFLEGFAVINGAAFYSLPVCVGKSYETIDGLCGLRYRKGGRKAATKQFAMVRFELPGDLPEHVYDAYCVIEAGRVYVEQTLPRIAREAAALAEQWGE